MSKGSRRVSGLKTERPGFDSQTCQSRARAVFVSTLAGAGRMERKKPGGGGRGGTAGF